MFIFHPFRWRRWLLLWLMFSASSIQAQLIKQSSGHELADEKTVFLSLWKQADERQLSLHPYWLKLLHFYSFGESVGQWSFKSDIVSSDFFLSQEGKIDPTAELKATLKA